MSEIIIPRRRLVEIDVARGIATVAMILYHFCWDLNYFVGDLKFPFWVWKAGSIVIGSSFLFLVGLSYWIESRHKENSELRTKLFKKTSRVLISALTVSVVSLLYTPEQPIFFGILHCIAISYLILPFCVRLSPRILSVLSALCLGVGTYLYVDPLQHSELLWLARSRSRVMSDHYPLLPWFGVALLGYTLGRTLIYPLHNRERSAGKAQTKITQALSFMGRHTLMIYLLHQPVMVGAIKLFGLARK